MCMCENALDTNKARWVFSVQAVYAKKKKKKDSCLMIICFSIFRWKTIFVVDN